MKKKMSAWVDLEFLLQIPDICLEGLLCSLCQKDFKIKFGFDGSISNTYLGHFYPNNQIVLIFATF